MEQSDTWLGKAASSQDTHGRLASHSAGDALYGELYDFALAARPHQPITSERELSRQYGISVATVRRTLERLVKERLVYKRERLGNFVADRPATRGGRQLKTLIYVDCWGDDTRPAVVHLMRGLASGSLDWDLRLQMLHAPAGQAFWANQQMRQALLQTDVVAAAVPYVTPQLEEELRRQNPRLKLISVADFGSGAKDCTIVGPDYFAVGRQGAEWLMEHGARRIHCVDPSLMTTSGATYAADRYGPQHGGVAVIPVPCGSWASADVELACQFLREATPEPEAVIFSDDRFAAECIARLGPLGRQLLDRRRIVSLANVGEKTLPKGVVRLEFEWFEIGRATVATAAAMVRGQLQGHEQVLVRPRLTEDFPEPGGSGFTS